MRRIAPWVQAGRFADHGCVQDVESVKGACMVARREAVDQVGGFDEQFFLFAEETDWTLRFLQNGWRVVYHPGAVVMHHGGQSAGREAGARAGRRLLQKHQSHLRFYAKHRPRWQVLLFRACMSAAVVVRLAAGVLSNALRGRSESATQEALKALLRLYWDRAYAAQNVYRDMSFRHF